MKCKITQRVFDAARHSNHNIDTTINWILGYFSKKNDNISLVCHLIEESDRLIEVDIEDTIIIDLESKFGFHSDSLISTLLVIAYSLGGAE